MKPGPLSLLLEVEINGSLLVEESMAPGPGGNHVDDDVLTRRAASKMGRGRWPAHAPIDEVVNALKRAPPAERMRMEEGLRRYAQQVAPRWGQPEPTCPPARLR
ncbi:MAG TPA: hypothetical protein VGQ24_04615 [Gemmatimonadales bacterium]|nr:hypothetical protein [Gemmatimonadales bacterium]